MMASSLVAANSSRHMEQLSFIDFIFGCDLSEDFRHPVSPLRSSCADLRCWLRAYR